MKTRTMAAATVVALAMVGSALAQTPRPAAPANDTGRTTTSTPATRGDTTSTATPPVSGANSFTEGEARSRIEKTGYSNVSGLKKDAQGVWRGSAMKDGKTVEVSLDYKGNVVPMEQNAQAPAAPRPATAPTAPAPTR